MNKILCVLNTAVFLFQIFMIYNINDIIFTVQSKSTLSPASVSLSKKRILSELKDIIKQNISLNIPFNNTKEEVLNYLHFFISLTSLSYYA